MIPIKGNVGNALIRRMNELNGTDIPEPGNNLVIDAIAAVPGKPNDLDYKLYHVPMGEVSGVVTVRVTRTDIEPLVPPRTKVYVKLPTGTHKLSAMEPYFEKAFGFKVTFNDTKGDFSDASVVLTADRAIEFAMAVGNNSNRFIAGGVVSVILACVGPDADLAASDAIAPFINGDNFSVDSTIASTSISLYGPKVVDTLAISWGIDFTDFVVPENYRRVNTDGQNGNWFISQAGVDMFNARIRDLGITGFTAVIGGYLKRVNRMYNLYEVYPWVRPDIVASNSLDFDTYKHYALIRIVPTAGYIIPYSIFYMHVGRR